MRLKTSISCLPQGNVYLIGLSYNGNTRVHIIKHAHLSKYARMHVNIQYEYRPLSLITNELNQTNNLFYTQKFVHIFSSCLFSLSISGRNI